jgi:poly(3-hydroxyoctanoate) depolymerase
VRRSRDVVCAGWSWAARRVPTGFVVAGLVASAPAACGGSEQGAASISVEAGADVASAMILDGAVGADSGTVAVDAAARDAAPVCSITPDLATCNSDSRVLAGRTVTFATPSGPAPAGGWPTVVFYQGSFVPGHAAFSARPADAFAQYELVRTIAVLLDRGYLVVAPDASSNGSTFWQTNVPLYAQNWEGCDDDLLVRALLAGLGAGTFGPSDATRLYAMGISSGGYMTSRMAVSYPGRFRALVDHSASYATCSGTFCIVPTSLPSSHPPTLLLRGDVDALVSMPSVTPYIDALTRDGHEVKFITGAGEGHQWLKQAALAVPDWFDAHR